jgi:hypothetical protein
LVGNGNDLADCWSLNYLKWNIQLIIKQSKLNTSSAIISSSLNSLKDFDEEFFGSFDEILELLGGNIG